MNEEDSDSLIQAAANGDLDKIKEFIKGRDINDLFLGLCSASRENQLHIVEFLVKSGADVNKGNYGGTPLYIAAQNGCQSVVEFLVKSGADINMERRHGTTPLYIAAQKGRQSVVEFLVKSGADINKGRKGGATPLYIAAQNGH